MELFALLDINAQNIAYKPLAKLQLPLYTYSLLRGKQTYGGGSGWSIEGRKNMTNCLWQSRLTEKKRQAVQSTAPSFFHARCRCEQLAKHNAKDDARPRTKAAYHRMSMNKTTTTQMKRIVRMKTLSCRTMKTTVTVKTTTCIVL